MAFLERIQEFLADRFKFIQYPKIKRLQQANTRPSLKGVDVGLILILTIPAMLIACIGIAISCFVLYLIVDSFL